MYLCDDLTNIKNSHWYIYISSFFLQNRKETIIQEIWKDIEDYEGLYQVSNLGKVKSLPKLVNRKNNSKYLTNEKILKPLIFGYARVILSNKSYSVHS